MATDGTIAAARIAAGAPHVRTLQPGMQATTDYRDDRLNVVVDAAGIVTTLRCG